MAAGASADGEGGRGGEEGLVMAAFTVVVTGS
jgi:hypothetical protein